MVVSTSFEDREIPGAVALAVGGGSLFPVCFGGNGVCGFSLESVSVAVAAVMIISISIGDGVAIVMVFMPLPI